jgi:hypothetical protein
MTRLILVPLGLAALAIMVFSLVDIALTNKRSVRSLTKPLWLLVVLIPLAGALLWFLFGRPRRSPGGQTRMIAPDDDPDFLRNLKAEEESEERIRRLEQELSDLDDDPPAP